MKMMKYLICLASLIAIISSSCGRPKPNGLSISVNPPQPVLIPGSGSFTFGGVVLTAPLFVVNSINLDWTGSSNLEIVDISIVSPPGGPSATSTSLVPFTCSLVGDQLLTTFPTLSATGNVILTPNTNANSAQVACAGLTLPNPLPSTLSVQAAVTILGVTLDKNGNATGRVSTTQNITIQ